MPDPRVEKVKLVLQTDFFKVSVGGGIHFRADSAVFHIDNVNVFHKADGFALADMLMQAAAESVGNVIFSVRKSTRAAEAGHNRTGFAVYAAFNLNAVDRAFSFFERMSLIEHRDFKRFVGFCKLVSGVNSARTCADDNNVVNHILPPEKRFKKRNEQISERYFITFIKLNQAFIFEKRVKRVKNN